MERAVVRVSVVHGDSYCGIVYILPAFWGVGQSAIYLDQEEKRSDLGILRHSAGEVLRGRGHF